ncbi:YopX family protein [Enterococcus sp. DIV0240a]|uniref:YopX family protein n=1 Tax=unclassified Enterococcus TaxID=2608891 RepID=UPI003D2C1FA0
MIPKFRAWDKKYEEMTRVNRIDFERKAAQIEADSGDHELRHTITRKLNEIILMQSTGLKDKNGVEVFEGDILHRKVHVILLGTDLNEWVDEYAHVEWKYGGWHVGEDLLEFVLEEGIDRHTGCSQTALEVIGNIYENPDLLDSDLVEVD